MVETAAFVVDGEDLEVVVGGLRRYHLGCGKRVDRTLWVTDATGFDDLVHDIVP